MAASRHPLTTANDPKQLAGLLQSRKSTELSGDRGQQRENREQTRNARILTE